MTSYDSLQLNAVLVVCPSCQRSWYRTAPGSICRDCTGIVAIGVSR